MTHLPEITALCRAASHGDPLSSLVAIEALLDKLLADRDYEAISAILKVYDAAPYHSTRS